MKIPEHVRAQVRELLWERAAAVGWSALADIERSRFYEQWTRDIAVGGVLAHYMDARRVRVYLKDSLMKPYERARLLGTERKILVFLMGAEAPSVVERYIKPNGVRFEDGRIVCWGRSRDWKLVLMALYERAASSFSRHAFGLVLLENGSTADEGTRHLVRDASARLGVERVVWLED
jgi:hypothetical protein